MNTGKTSHIVLIVLLVLAAATGQAQYRLQLVNTLHPKKVRLLSPIRDYYFQLHVPFDSLQTGERLSQARFRVLMDSCRIAGNDSCVDELIRQRMAFLPGAQAAPSQYIGVLEHSLRGRLYRTLRDSAVILVLDETIRERQSPYSTSAAVYHHSRKYVGGGRLHPVYDTAHYYLQTVPLSAFKNITRDVDNRADYLGAIAGLSVNLILFAPLISYNKHTDQINWRTYRTCLFTGVAGFTVPLVFLAGKQYHIGTGPGRKVYRMQTVPAATP